MSLILGFSLLLAPSIKAQNIDNFTPHYQPLENREGMQACVSTYSQKLKTPGVLNIAVAFGYSDTTDEGFNLVTDQWTHRTLVENLTKRCEYSNQGFCEFTKQSDAPHTVQHYTRELSLKDQNKILVHFYVMNSSYDGSNEDNLTIYKNEQLLKSERAQNFYGWAIKNADVVFYEGHSRDGGGPDFLPPRPKRNGTVDYSWYHKNQPGLKFLLSQLEVAAPPPMIFGLFSCASKPHFESKLSPYFSSSNMILSTKVVEAHYTKEALLSSLESVLNFECGSDLQKRLNGTSFVVKQGLNHF
jgi:hypothetical protein